MHTTGPQFMTIVEGADHVSYVDVVDRLALLNADPAAPAEAIAFYDALHTLYNTSGEGAIDNRLGTAITNAYAVAFFQSVLAGNADFDQFLAPEYAVDHQLPVQFESVGFPPVAVLPGDYNNDGVVDATDYTVWRDGGRLNFTPADYDRWKANFGAVAASGVSHDMAVPEPPSLLLLCGLMLVKRRSQVRSD